jgi:hypothetical protein
MGADIAGACGQLVVGGEKEEEEYRRREKLADIEDGPFREDGSRKPPRTTIVALPSKRRKEEVAARETQEEDELRGNGQDRWVRRLTVATVVAATCFVVSSGLLLLQKRKHK